MRPTVQPNRDGGSVTRGAIQLRSAGVVQDDRMRPARAISCRSRVWHQHRDVTHRLVKRYIQLSARTSLMMLAHMYVPMPATHNIRKISRFLSLRGILCCRIWSSFVRFRPSAFKHEATRTISSPSIVFCRECHSVVCIIVIHTRT